MEIETGNAGRIDTNETGWIIGFGGHIAGDSLRFMNEAAYARTVCVKWMEHPKDDPRGKTKPPSKGRTISILVSENGKFRIRFSATPDFREGEARECVLDRHGDFVIWGEDVFHRWFVDEPCTVLTVRWVPVENPDRQAEQEAAAVQSGKGDGKKCRKSTKGPKSLVQFFREIPLVGLLDLPRDRDTTYRNIRL